MTSLVFLLQNHLPVFTVPFTLVGLVFLLTSDEGGALHRVAGHEESYPEKQSYTWWTGKGDRVPQVRDKYRRLTLLKARTCLNPLSTLYKPVLTFFQTCNT